MSFSETIFSNTYTYSDFYRRFSLLKEFSESLIYIKDEEDLSITDRLETFFIEKKVSPENMEAMREWGDSFFGEIINSGNIYKVFHRIEEEFKEVPLFMLQTPVELPMSKVRIFGKWFRDNVDRNAFSVATVNSDIVAGCFFSWKNNLYDMSFNRLRRDRHSEISSRVKEIITASV